MEEPKVKTYFSKIGQSNWNSTGCLGTQFLTYKSVWLSLETGWDPGEAPGLVYGVLKAEFLHAHDWSWQLGYQKASGFYLLEVGMHLHFSVYGSLLVEN